APQPRKTSTKPSTEWTAGSGEGGRSPPGSGRAHAARLGMSRGGHRAWGGSWRPDAAPNGPRAAANGPRAGANGPRAGANGPRAGAHGPRAGAHGPRAGAYGPRAAARGPRARPKTTLTASQGRFSYPDAQEVRGGVAGVSRF